MVPSDDTNEQQQSSASPRRSIVEDRRASKSTWGRLGQWVVRGTPWVWINAGAVTISVLMLLGLLGLIAVRGLVYFWPSDIVQVQLKSDYVDAGAVGVWAGNLWSEETVKTDRVVNSVVPEGQDLVRRYLLKTGNRELDGFDFRWINDFEIESKTYPANLLKIERREWGNFYGLPEQIIENGEPIKHASYDELVEALNDRLERALTLYSEVKDIETHEIGSINYQLERLRLQERKYELQEALTAEREAELKLARETLDEEYAQLQTRRDEIYQKLGRDVLRVQTVDGREKDIPLSQIVSFIAPNTLGVLEKSKLFVENFINFLVEEPREANTEGGVFPAIFGTVVMVLLMSVLVTPFGVIAAVYLREYAKQGFVTRTVRIAVNNLAGVPSIVYGVFGLGFFVYFLGGSIDDLFYPEAAPAPVFGTSGLMWASFTLALLTVPVVIVATEEGLSRIPRSLREGSYALGATKFETMVKIIIPMSSPAIMTGMILAVARAAGEVAPLMLVGVVKLAPTLPLDGNYPFLHLDRKFMHLGFHIYDVGFQSPNVEAARPLVYATAGLLVAVIGFLNLAAVYIRNNLREKYKSLEM